MMLGVDGGLHIVADHASSAPAGGHGPRIWIGQRDLLVGRVLNRPLHRPQGLHLSPQAGNLLLQPARLGLGDIALFAVSAIQRREVPRDAGVDLLQPLADLGHREVLVAIVHRFELATVDRNNGTREEFEPTAKLDEPSANRSDRLPIVLAEVGDRLEVRRQPPDQPHQLDIALRFPFEPPARLNAVEIAVEVNLQQRLLHPILAIDEPMHRQAPEAPKRQDSKATSPRTESAQTAISRCFHTAWTLRRPSAMQHRPAHPAPKETLPARWGNGAGGWKANLSAVTGTRRAPVAFCGERAGVFPGKYPGRMATR